MHRIMNRTLLTLLAATLAVGTKTLGTQPLGAQTTKILVKSERQSWSGLS